MSELEFFLLMGILIQNSNTMELIKKIWKNTETWHPNQSGHIEDDIIQNQSAKTKVEKEWKSKNLWAKQTSFLAPSPSTLGQF
jgi:hypothetical protein